MSGDVVADRGQRSAVRAVGVSRVTTYVTGNIGMNLLFQSMAVYLLYFYTDVFGLTAAAAGSVLLIARIVDLVLDPVIGVTIDRTRSRWGKFRPYLLFGPLPLGVLAVLCFTAPGVGDGVKMLYATVLYSLFSIAYAVVNVAYAAMLPSLTGDYYQRGVISGIRELVGTVAILVVNSGTLFFVHRFGSEAVGFPIVMAIYAVVATLTLWVVFGGSRGVGERPSSEPEAKPVPLRAMLRTLAGNTPLYQVLGFNFASILAAGVHLATMVYYFKYYLERDDLFPPFQLVSTLAMFAAMFSVPMLVRRTGKRAATIVSQVITVAGLAGLFMLSHDIVMVFVMGSIASAGFGMTRAVIWGVIPDTVEYGQWRSGQRSEGVIYAAFIGVEKLGSAASAGIVGIVLGISGFVANATQTPEALFGVLSLLTLVPIAATVIVVLVMGRYRLDGTRFDSIITELAQRRDDEATPPATGAH